MSELLIRTLAAAAMIVLALMATVIGGYAFALLVAAGATAIFYEWSRLVRGRGFGWMAGGFLYALAAAVALLWVRDRADQGLALVLWIFVITWSTDIGAYFAGRKFGRTKLAPTISPNKTRAGLYGGMALAALLGALWVDYAQLSPALYLFAPIFALMAQIGDLFESWLKRRAGVKDSGRLLPGHGGVFDRLDGLMPVAILTALANVAGLA